MPDLAAVPNGSSAVYRIAAVDERGRIAERAVIQALGWSAGQRVRFDLLSATALVVRPETAGLFGLTRRGHIPLPVPVRRWCGVQAGDRVLLAASVQRGLLAVYTMAALESMINEFRLPADGGERS
ncbi:AbrB/MazE/SpoVT family DNA-binding domain-containing protein [Saccharopolyspora gloriosae]|uniref:AbrB/MazE/SpoVT family DNA-binding domain-containing protein n=1 Tax=Saccharopolyspora gloriosae TaxID=455344 RepID=UPI001FB78749|nr:AbrB/MazE/SpoVT family DNA-binding domain-containing protein [Saccharopolyspora gloriosae]